jgi:hypothetical protein
MLAEPIGGGAINVARPCWPAQPSGGKPHQAQGRAPEQALGLPGPFAEAFLCEALQIEVDLGLVSAAFLYGQANLCH